MPGREKMQQHNWTSREQRQFRLYTGTVVIAAVVMFIAPSVIQWVTGFQEYGNRYCSQDPAVEGTNRDDVCLPKDMSGIFDKLINGLRALGGVVLVAGMIWSGIKLQAVPKRSLRANTRRDRQNSSR
ncbi:hypothetical protein AKJ65_01335 [candidate division MSBL1 archaeon SCGC-AAA259E19]|uniref:Uncharacterized protein n=1 Tax=candidate division MSBL1 archaeon SCGC-AAA259E19 TaxID=1698264 RepID=A0A133UNC3_9EURY|nr:hypothetical protein AKJ65_01335 [candidate division MSBL1 archaeon SCGC-AAA259E19]